MKQQIYFFLQKIAEAFRCIRYRLLYNGQHF